MEKTHPAGKEPAGKKSSREWQRRADEYLAGWQRAKADLINYKKDEAKRVTTAYEYGQVAFFEKLLPVLDAFDQAVKVIPAETKDHPWASGLIKIRDEFLRVLKDGGFTVIESEGRTFDPAQHEILEEVEADQKTSRGKVIEVLRRGYRYKGEVVRPAGVRVGK